MTALYFYAKNGYNIKYDIKIERSEILYRENNKNPGEKRCIPAQNVIY